MISRSSEWTTRLRCSEYSRPKNTNGSQIQIEEEVEAETA